MAKIQTQGRGQRGTSWLSAAYQNLTVSIYLRPHELPVSKQFYLTIISSLALRDTLRQYTDQPVSIKWPNDIYVGRQKICGLLLENRISGTQISSAVLGIGLNVLQTVFAGELQHKATSLQLLSPHRSYSFIEIIQQIQRYLGHYHNLLAAGQHDSLLRQYNEYLYQKGEQKTYWVESQAVEGRIIGVKEDGLLQVQHGNTLSKYNLKELAYGP